MRMHERAFFSPWPIVVGALALVLAPLRPALAQDSTTPASVAPASLPDEPPFPPPALEGEAPLLADEPAPATSQMDAPPAAVPVPPPADEKAGNQAAPRRPPAARNPTFVQPPPLPPAPDQPRPAGPVPDDVKHARGIALMMMQIPIGALWGAAVAGTGFFAASALLAAPGLTLFPAGGLLAIAPLAVSIAGGGVAVLVNLGTAVVVDMLSGHAAPEGTTGKLLLWSSLYAGMVAVVAGLPLAIPVALAASGVFSNAEVSNVLAYTLVAALIPVAVAPMAMLEAANEAGYQSDLPAWCWHAMSICSLGTYVFF
ncbi:MAG: hypothetical protein ABIJ09_07990 [Pseudomonadota bacterium]